MPKFAVILPAAGRSTRFRDKLKKPFVDLDGRAIWIRAAEAFINRDDVCQTILVISPEDRDKFQERFAANLAFMGVTIVDGGPERVDSVANALARVVPEADFVAVHDAARPCMITDWVDSIFAQAAKTGAALLAIPLTDTLKRVGPNRVIEETLSRDRLWLAQTPQVFRKDLLIAAYARRTQFKQPPTDDAALVEAAGHPVTVVEGSPLNVKVTTRADLSLAAAALKALPKPKVTAPAHPFAEDDMWGGRPK